MLGGVVGVGLLATTVVNSGTIEGRFQSVLFEGIYANRLVFDPGAVFIGIVQAAEYGLRACPKMC